MVNPKVFFDIAIRKAKAGCIVTELFKDVVPKTAENFRRLCTSEKGIGVSGKPLHYKGFIFHRSIPYFMCQRGDFTRGNTTGGESIYKTKFAYENFVKKQWFLVFICTDKTSWLDGNHVVIGKVVDGYNVVEAIEKFGSHAGNTKSTVEIEDCGEVKED